MVRNFSNQRRHRVPVPLKRSEFKALETYAAKIGVPQSRVLLALTERAIAQILDGQDPLQALVSDESEASAKPA